MTSHQGGVSGPAFSRRGAGLLTAAALISHGTTVQAQGGTVMSHPLPCATQPGDIAALQLEGSGSPAGTVAVFGQAFRPGDLPRGGGLRARLADGRAIPAQLDVSVRHADGSARFALVSIVLPALPEGRVLGIVLSTGPATAEPPLDLATALAGRQAVLSLQPIGGGPVWRADLLTLLRDAAAAGRERPWQSGMLAVQRRVVAQVPAEAVGGVTSLRLVADIACRADGTLWVDAWLRNDIAMRPGGGTASYTVRIALDGREVLRAEELRHFQYQGWGRLLGTAAGGTPPPRQPLLRPNTAYLAAAGAVAPYDLTTGVEEALLGRLARALTEPGWARPLGPRDITQYMETAGGRADLGPTTMYQAAWLTSGDPRAALYCLGQAEAAGSIPWHFWDPRGGWMDERRWRGFWFDARNGPPPLSLLQPVNHQESGWHTSASHQPDPSYVPYLLTGRRALLDELLAQAAWNVLSLWPHPRDTAGAARGVNMIHRRQVRSAAWTMRQIDEAAWLCPDDDPQQEYFRDVADRNWAWLRSRLPALTERQGEAHGWIVPVGFGDGGSLSPWQQDYFASSVAAAARRGSSDARAVLAWMANFLVGRFQSEDRGFNPRDGVAYLICIARTGGEGDEVQPFRTWAEIGAATRARDWSNETGWRHSGGEYGRLGLMSLAMVHEILGHDGARRAYNWLIAAAPPYTGPQNFASSPTHNVVPPGVQRLPSRALACG